MSRCLVRIEKAQARFKRLFKKAPTTIAKPNGRFHQTGRLLIKSLIYVLLGKCLQIKAIQHYKWYISASLTRVQIIDNMLST